MISALLVILLEAMAARSNGDEFKLEKVSLEFGKCFEGGNVRMDKYIDAYTEVIR